MGTLNRTIHAVIAAVVLTIGTMQLAYASGQAPAIGEMELCTGHGIITVGIDADGNPTGEIFYCPDCEATFIALENGVMDVPAFCANATSVLHVPVASDIASDPRFPHPARGPPVSV